MAYIPLTKEQYQKAINAGYSPEQIIANEKIRKEKSVEVEQKGLPRLASNVGGALSNVFTGTVEGLQEAYNKQMAEVKELQEESVGASGLDKLKGIGEYGLRTVGNTIGAAFSPVAPIVSEVGKGISSFGEMIGVNDDIRAVVDKIKETDAYKGSEEKIKSALVKYGEWAEKNPDMAKDTEALAEIALLLIGGKPAQSAVKGTMKTGKEVAKSTVKTIGDVGGSVGGAISAVEKPIAGIGQKIKEEVQKIPRVVERVGVGLEKSADKATRLKTATPEVKKAIESGLDDKIINFVTEADDVTKEAMKKVVKIAEEKPALGKTSQPSKVAGDLAVKQYNLIDAEKKRIGKQLGDRINALSKTTTVDIKDSLKSLDDILNSQGILKTLNKKGKIELDFTTSKFTKAERAKISELYELATEGGSKLTPAQIKAKDQMFSKMQRESKMESIGDIIIDTPEGQKNLFQAFRDVYNSKLDSIDPTIRELNRKYAELARITDDIEDSILKTPNFNITKSADQSEFAKVNLRRIFAENQSSAVYEDIVNQMDDWARVLGYKDASPKEIMDFSLEMRKLFPETVPKTGFTGGINAGVESTIINTLGKALTSGKPNLIDQQKALKALLGIDDVILPKLNKPLNTGSKINVNLPKAGVEVKNTKIDANLPKKKVDKVELPQKSSGINNLTEEARKYKSAEEFIKEQEKQYRYHETGLSNLDSIKDKGLKPTVGQYGKGVYFAPKTGINEASQTGLILRVNKKDLQQFGYQEFSEQGWTNMSKVPAEILEYSKDGGKNWYDMKDNAIKTKSQLTDIWNKANNFSKVENPLLNIPKIKSPERINYLERYNINKAELLQDKDVIITKFFNEIKKNEPKFINITEDIASNFGGEYAYRMKSPESVLLKMDRRGDKFTLGNIDDALGSTVITNDIDGALLKATKDYKITNVDDFRKNPTFLGYKAVHLDVELPNGQIAEIQLNTRNGLIRKEEGHKTYEKWRKYIETAQGSDFDDILKKIPQENKAEFIKDVEYSIGIFDGTIPVPEEVIKLVEERIIKTKNPLSSVMNNKKQPS